MFPLLVQRDGNVLGRESGFDYLPGPAPAADDAPRL